VKPMKVSASKAEDYYYQADPVYGDGSNGNGVWIGDGASELGLTGTVDLEQFNNLLYGMTPDGNNRLVGKEADHHKNAATDIPLSVSKSMSLVALYDPKFREALTKAFADTAKHIAERHVYTRQTNDGVTELVQGKAVVAMFNHSTSRANDAHMHPHIVVLNMVQREDGKWRTLENRPLYVAQKENQQELFSRAAAAARESGYAIELSRNRGGMFVPEVSGISRDVVEQFSKRWEDIKDAGKLANALARKMPGLNAKDIDELVQLHTKAEKNLPVSETEMVSAHTLQLKGLGTTPEDLLSTAKELGASQQVSGMTARDFIRIAAEDLIEHESVVNGSKIVSEAVKISVGEMTRPDLEKAFQEARLSGEFVHYGADRFSTPDMQAKEWRVTEIAVRDRQVFTPLMSQDEALGAVAAFEKMREITATEGQARAIEYVLTGTGRLMLIQGDAGSGKSTAFAAIFTALQDRDGVTARGFGFQGKAAAELERSSGLPSQTIDSFLLSKPDETTGRQLWVVDEASMVGSRHLYEMVKRAEQENAQMVLVGDGKQIAAIAAGRLFLDLQDHGLVESSRMEEIRRQKTDYTREIATALKNHDVGAAFAVLERTGNLHEITDREERIQFAAERYVAAGDDALVMTVTNRDRKELIEAIRSMEQAEGRVGEDHVFSVRTPVNLVGVDKRLAASYEPGNRIFLREETDGLKSGSEAKIISRDSGSNSITVQDEQGQSHVIDVRRHGGRLSQFEETPTAFGEGEKVIWTKNDNSDYGKEHMLKNGVTGVIERIGEDGMVSIRTEHDHLVEVTMEGSYITNGQAITIDKAQGATAGHSITMMPSDAPVELLSENKNYVAMTRMTKELELITDNKADLLEMVNNPQDKTSTLDHVTQRLEELKEQAQQSLKEQKTELEGTSEPEKLDLQRIQELEDLANNKGPEHTFDHDHDNGHGNEHDNIELSL